MGASYISMGATIAQGLQIDQAGAEAIVRKHFPTIKAELAEIDASGRFDDADEDDAELISLIASGIVWLHSGEERDTWNIPQHPNLQFATAGGLSWGDSPFEEYDAAVLAADAAATLPAFGREVRILGGGIRFDYPTEEG